MAPKVGDRLRDYRLESIIGKGGMATVFLGIHELLGRKSAIKVLSDELVSDEMYVRRFLSEARVVNEIHHPNVVDIYDFVVVDSPKTVALVMELIDGTTLDKELKRGPVSISDTLDVCEQLVRALKVVHERNVIHRDLKPENLMISRREGEVFIKVLDFGIAKVPEGNQTQSGLVFGTPFYMAPEQASGGQASPASDLYAVGEILFECLAGRRLFRGEPLAVLRAKVFEGPPQVSFKGTGSDVLASLVTRCISTTPEERPKHDEILAELDRLRGILGLWPARTPGGSRLTLQREPSGISASGGIQLSTETLKGESPGLAKKHYAMLGGGIALGLLAAFIVRTGPAEESVEALVVPVPAHATAQTEPAKASLPVTMPAEVTRSATRAPAKVEPVSPPAPPSSPTGPAPAPTKQESKPGDPAKMIPKRERMTWDE
ncbi:MAG: serine/threonine protein kinase [Deltaproteobacteria bacterium]|nr:serine/threonine protein kinase [Deltaproteobacteria bacterium]